MVIEGGNHEGGQIRSDVRFHVDKLSHWYPPGESLHDDHQHYTGSLLPVLIIVQRSNINWWGVGLDKLH